MVPGKYLYFPFTLEHHLDQSVDVFGFLRFFPNFSKNNIGIQTAPDVHGLFILVFVFVADKADLVGMHEVISVCQIYLLISQFDPNQLLHQLIPPTLHDFKGRVELGVQNPQENEPLISDRMKRQLFYLMVAHGVVLEGKFTI